MIVSIIIVLTYHVLEQVIWLILMVLKGVFYFYFSYFFSVKTKLEKINDGHYLISLPLNLMVGATITNEVASVSIFNSY